MTRARRLGIAALLLAAALSVIAVPAALRRAGAYLIEDDAPQHADVIAVLAGGYPDRILEAVDLYRHGWAPRLMLGRAPENAGFRRLDALGVHVPRLVDLNRMVAEQLGVPPAAIDVVAQTAGSTYDEAQVLIDAALRHGDSSILLVTSKYHSRRAARIYRYLAGDRLRITVCAARDDDFQPDGWWRNRVNRRRVVFEYQKLLGFWLYDRWRSRPAWPGPATPAAG